MLMWIESSKPPTKQRTEGFGGNTERPLPVPAGWLQWRMDMPQTLKVWVMKFAANSSGMRYPSTMDAFTLMQWLHRHLGLMSIDPQIVDFTKDLNKWVGQATRYAGRADKPAATILCPALITNDTGQDKDCGHRLVLYDGVTEIGCPGCGAKWTKTRLMAVAAYSKGEAWIDTEAAAAVAGVDASTLRRWAARGKVQRKRGRYLLQSLPRIQL